MWDKPHNDAVKQYGRLFLIGSKTAVVAYEIYPMQTPFNVAYQEYMAISSTNLLTKTHLADDKKHNIITINAS